MYRLGLLKCLCNLDHLKTIKIRNSNSININSIRLMCSQALPHISINKQHPCKSMFSRDLQKSHPVLTIKVRINNLTSHNTRLMFNLDRHK